jgi:hypothetical protein
VFKKDIIMTKKKAIPSPQISQVKMKIAQLKNNLIFPVLLSQ